MIVLGIGAILIASVTLAAFSVILHSDNSRSQQNCAF